MTEALTAEERALLLGHAAGRYTADIAAELGLTTAQYLYRRGRLLGALGALDHTHALAVAIVRGIVAPEDLRRAGVY